MINNKSILLDFWQLFIQPKKKNRYIELRAVPYTDDWKQNKKLFIECSKVGQTLSTSLIIYPIQFFVNDFNDVEKIFESEIPNLSKLCYGVNERKVNDMGLIGGAEEFIDEIKLIYFDIESTRHGELSEYENNVIDDFVEVIKNYIFFKYELEHPLIIYSGAGRHLLYKITPNKLTDGRKRFLKKMNKDVCKFNNEFFKVDNIADPTRILGLPGVKNPKWNKYIRIKNSIFYTNEYKIPSLKEPKNIDNIEFDDKNLPKPKDSVEWKIMNNPTTPVGDTNNTIVFNFKLLLKSKGYTQLQQYKPFQDIVNKVWKTKLTINPNQGTKGKRYNPGTTINWCRRNEEWCNKNNIDYEYLFNLGKKEEGD